MKHPARTPWRGGRFAFKLSDQSNLWTDPIPDGKRNVYICEKRHEFNCVHATEGVTPFQVVCPWCGGWARSTMYMREVDGPIHGVWHCLQNDWWGNKLEQEQHSRQGGVFLYYTKHVEGQRQ